MDNTKLIINIWSKQATDSETAELKAWIFASEGNSYKYELLKLLWSDAQKSTGDNPDNFHKLGLVAIKTAIRKKRQKQKRKRRILFGLMAITILVIAYLLIAVFSPPHGRPDKITRFNQTPLREVVADLERKYDIKIEVKENLLDCTFSGSFYNDSPGQIIRVITERIKANYTVGIDRSFRIEGSGCNDKSKN
ncbi:FecR domain-containing protein [Chryseosolibacter indicus]|uniref:DUF4974 domain-containing protein n=1 Tax=Chryseosolibacter indicus TaxID=2782351 RepID=A0ABS5VX00_9BACT|nr:DUF4974 domain-containing protein [Chryseosolibacter indicus]MBT1705939.1 DUF4974 domain-containing protein [Chryseosolibacter indicus]